MTLQSPNLRAGVADRLHELNIALKVRGQGLTSLTGRQLTERQAVAGESSAHVTVRCVCVGGGVGSESCSLSRSATEVKDRHSTSICAQRSDNCSGKPSKMPKNSAVDLYTFHYSEVNLGRSFRITLQRLKYCPQASFAWCRMQWCSVHRGKQIAYWETS